MRWADERRSHRASGQPGCWARRPGRRRVPPPWSVVGGEDACRPDPEPRDGHARSAYRGRIRRPSWPPWYDTSRPMSRGARRSSSSRSTGKSVLRSAARPMAPDTRQHGGRWSRHTVDRPVRPARAARSHCSRRFRRRQRGPSSSCGAPKTQDDRESTHPTRAWTPRRSSGWSWPKPFFPGTRWRARMSGLPHRRHGHALLHGQGSDLRGAVRCPRCVSWTSGSSRSDSRETGTTCLWRAVAMSWPAGRSPSLSRPRIANVCSATSAPAGDRSSPSPRSRRCHGLRCHTSSGSNRGDAPV